jgi:hypothetical protein
MYARTVDQLLQQIHREYEGDTDYLEFEDEETQLRVEYVKDSIREWVNRFPEYREIFADLTSAADGTKTTSAGVTSYNCPTNFVRPSNVVKVGSKYLDYIALELIGLKNQENSAAEWFTITGRPGAYKVRINPAPTGSETIEYDYWKTITMPSTTTDTVEISRPMFCVYYTLWKIYKEDDPEQEEKYKNLMNEEERLERVALAKNPGSANTVKVQGSGFGVVGGGSTDILTDS